ncbi:MAG: hypothetical protein JO139_07525 [Alphaproteobacteria bacterium]|nr:hypothetical protein [Alphaproteobacteria bacterium]
MSDITIYSPVTPALVGAAGERALLRFVEFFAAKVRNPHTRRTCYRRGSARLLTRGAVR